jgi:hypothetical protein
MTFYSNERIFLSLPIAYMKQSCAPNSQIAYMEGEGILKAVALSTLMNENQITRRCTDSCFTFKERRQYLRKYFSLNCSCVACESNSGIEGRWNALRCPQCQGCCPSTTKICYDCKQPHLAFDKALDRTKIIAGLIKKESASYTSKKIINLMTEMRKIAWKENIHLIVAINEFFKFCFNKNTIQDDVKAIKIGIEDNFASQSISILVDEKGKPIWSMPYDIIRNSKFLHSLSEIAVLCGNMDSRNQFKTKSSVLLSCFTGKSNVEQQYYDMSDDSDVAELGDICKC